jgi:hypothetical protein
MPDPDPPRGRFRLFLRPVTFNEKLRDLVKEETAATGH